MTHLVTFSITENDNRLRVDEFLAARLGGLSRMRIARLIADGNCSLNGERVVAGKKVFRGDYIEFTIPETGPSSMTPERIPLDIAYEDDHLLAVIKPSGMLMHPTKGVKRGTLANGLTYYLNHDTFEKSEGSSRDSLESMDLICRLIRPGIIHRLDKETSGLVLAAKTTHALSILTRHFRKRMIERWYLALLNGNLDTNEGIISAPIGRQEDHKPYWCVLAEGKEAETRFRILKRLHTHTLVELEPVTGRTNQLRIHCAYIGHPIAGDSSYGSPCGPEDSPRLFLHAWKIRFRHPETGEWIVITSELPEALAQYMCTL